MPAGCSADSLKKKSLIQSYAKKRTAGKDQGVALVGKFPFCY